MIAVIFEVQPTAEGRQAYLDHAAALKPLLERMDGFISVERFQSLAQPDKLLSLSFCREMERHCEAQAAGRGGLFADYRLRVAHVVRDYGLTEREQVPR